MQMGIARPASSTRPSQHGHAAGHGPRLTATAAVFVTNTHLALFRGLAASLQAVPLGRGMPLTDPDRCCRCWAASSCSATGGGAGGDRVVLLDVVIAFSSRMMPQVNIYFISPAVKIGLGLSLSISLRTSARP